MTDQLHEWRSLADDMGDFILATPLPVGDQQFSWKHQRDKLLVRLDHLMAHDEGSTTTKGQRPYNDAEVTERCRCAYKVAALDDHAQDCPMAADVETAE